MSASDQTYMGSAWVMHARFQATLKGAEEKLLQDTFRHMMKVIAETEMLLSCHHPNAFTTKINHYPSGKRTDLPDEFREVLRLSKDYFEKTMGLFDVTLGSGKSLFRDHALTIPPQASSASRPFHLDFGGFARGYALRKVKTLLEELNIPDAHLTFGKNAQMHICKNKCNPVRFPIQEINKSFELVNEAVSVSSNASVMGNNNHIVHPETLQTVDSSLLVAVKSPDALDADVLSTALLPADPANYQNIVNRFEGAEVIIADRIEQNNLLYLTAHKTSYVSKTV